MFVQAPEFQSSECKRKPQCKRIKANSSENRNASENRNGSELKRILRSSALLTSPLEADRESRQTRSIKSFTIACIMLKLKRPCRHSVAAFMSQICSCTEPQEQMLYFRIVLHGKCLRGAPSAIRSLTMCRLHLLHGTARANA